MQGQFAKTIEIKLPSLPYWEILKEAFPDACIAGGYPRDLFFGRTPKDIDIWIPFLKPPLPIMTVCKTTTEEVISGVYQDVSEIRNIHKRIEPEAQYDLIESGLETIEEILEDFDLSICQIAIRADGSIVTTPAFLETIRTKTVTRGGKRSPKRLAARIERLKEKYPDFQFPEIEEENVPA